MFQLLLSLEKEEDRGHVVTLMDANALEDFSDFLVNLEDNFEVSIHCFDGSNEFGGGSIFLKNF